MRHVSPSDVAYLSVTIAAAAYTVFTDIPSWPWGLGMGMLIGMQFVITIHRALLKAAHEAVQEAQAMVEQAIEEKRS